MKYRHIVSITGMSGLYQLLSTKSNGAFVKSLEDLSNKFISSRTHQVTPLESIEIYTIEDNIYLHQVLEKLKSVDKELSELDFKDTKAFISVFEQAVPEYDKDRVYNSDIKKIMKWYLLLKKNDLLDFSEYLNPPIEEEPEAQEPTASTEEKEEKKPAKKTAKKKTETENESSDEPAKPAKKAKAKKVADEKEEKPVKKTAKKAATKKKEEE